MNAEEARKLAYTNAKDEIDRVNVLINKAASAGDTFLKLDYELKDGTISWLKNKGYSVSVYKDSTIKWDVLNDSDY